jgi:hypothetical protein
MRFEIQQQTEQRFVVVDASGRQTRGRFHTKAAAQDWVDEQARKALLAIITPQTSMRGRARAFLLTSSDYAGENERRIQRLTEEFSL